MRAPGALLSDAPWALAFRVLEPQPATPRRLLCLLHGFGSDERQLAGLGAAAGAETLVVLPRAPRSVHGGCFGWYRVHFVDNEPDIVADEAEDSRSRLVDFIAQLQHRHALAPARTIVAGFSQGGALAAGIALTAPERVAGFAIACGRILPEIEPRVAGATALAHLNGLLVHGRDDTTLPPCWAESAHAWLDRLGVRHQLRLHEGGHALSAAMNNDLLAWFADPRQSWNAA